MVEPSRGKMEATTVAAFVEGVEAGDGVAMCVCRAARAVGARLARDLFFERVRNRLRD